MANPVEAALSNPWGALRFVLDGPLHPGGAEATEALLDRANVADGTALLDIGCGAGESVERARARGARAVGLDRDPADGDAIRGDIGRLPVRSNSIDVAVAECVLCLADDRGSALDEVARILRSGGRLALSDVVVEGDLPPLPKALTRPLCLGESLSRAETLATLETRGFRVEGVRDHHDDLLDMRDRLAARVEYERLLGLLGERGQRLLDGIETFERAVEDERVSYVSVVASHAG